MFPAQMNRALHSPPKYPTIEGPSLRLSGAERAMNETLRPDSNSPLENDEPTTASRRTMLRELPEDERPRERLLRLGPEALADAELVAILLRCGTRRDSALGLAEGLLAGEGGLAGLARRDSAYLSRSAGLGAARSATLAAAFETGRRAARAGAGRRPLLSDASRVIAWLQPRAADWPEERVGLLVLDARHRLVFDREIVRGSLDQAAVTPRDVFRRALLDDAASVILYHNHPSGDPTPSRDDLIFTRALVEGGETVGIRVVDHVVVGRDGCVSLAARGEIRGGKSS